jgi:hypothetical protein
MAQKSILKLCGEHFAVEYYYSHTAFRICMAVKIEFLTQLWQTAVQRLPNTVSLRNIRPQHPGEQNNFLIISYVP